MRRDPGGRRLGHGSIPAWSTGDLGHFFSVYDIYFSLCHKERLRNRRPYIELMKTVNNEIFK